MMSANIGHQFLTIPLTFPFYYMEFFEDFCEGGIPFPLFMRNNVQSHLHRAKQPVAIGGGGGGGGRYLSNGRFCGRSGIFVLKKKNNKCRNKMQKAVCIQTLSTP